MVRPLTCSAQDFRDAIAQLRQRRDRAARRGAVQAVSDYEREAAALARALDRVLPPKTTRGPMALAEVLP